MGPKPFDGEAVTTQCGLCPYLYTVKSDEARDQAKSVMSQCFAKNTESKTLSELSLL